MNWISVLYTLQSARKCGAVQQIQCQCENGTSLVQVFFGIENILSVSFKLSSQLFLISFIFVVFASVCLTWVTGVLFLFFYDIKGDQLIYYPAPRFILFIVIKNDRHENRILYLYCIIHDTFKHFKIRCSVLFLLALLDFKKCCCLKTVCFKCC